MATQARQLNLDAMRLIGVLIIMVAHASPPDWIFQLRNFGTPLLIVASALTYSTIYGTKTLEIATFYRKRLSRLIFPAWIFLTVFFSSFWVVAKVYGKSFPFSPSTVVSSYSFYSGIGFIWVFKVYIFLALLTPLAVRANRTTKSSQRYFLMLAGLFCCYLILINVGESQIEGSFKQIINELFFTSLAYSVLYFYGFRAYVLSNGMLLKISLISFVLFAAIALMKLSQTGFLVQTQADKYPPGLYYFSYSFFALNLVYFGMRNVTFSSVRTKNLIIWLSSNSLWIYLWHILAVYIWTYA